MLKINNTKYAETEAEMIDSLFNPGGTCAGYAKKTKRSIKFYTIQHKIFAVINQWGVLCEARQLDNGKIWYTHASEDLDKKFGKIDTSKISTGFDFNCKNEKRLIFK